MLPALLLVACSQPPEDEPGDGVRQRLVGTWLREYDEPGAHVRRVLVLEAGGRFVERSRVVPIDGAAAIVSEGEGRWIYDGVNLKRHYRQINGRSTYWSGNPFVTFELSFPTRLSFDGVDHVRQRRVHYERVADDTQA